MLKKNDVICNPAKKTGVRFQYSYQETYQSGTKQVPVYGTKTAGVWCGGGGLSNTGNATVFIVKGYGSWSSQYQGSGSVEFNNVTVQPGQVYSPPGHHDMTYNTLGTSSVCASDWYSPEDPAKRHYSGNTQITIPNAIIRYDTEPVYSERTIWVKKWKKL